MIQRIQTIYLLLVTAMMAVTLFMPLALFSADGEEYRLFAFALKDAAGEVAQPAIYMGIVLALACVLPFITIFLFKRRLLQLRLCVAEMILLGGSVVMEAVYYFLGCRFFAEFPFYSQSLRPSAVLPLICLVFAYLATRAIFHDELLVRAADRIR